MKLIKKKKALPRKFQIYQNSSNASFSEMDKEVKDELRLSLLNEQGWVCAYCQQKLKQDSSAYVKIEHHCEQTICNGENGTEDKRLDYQNLFAVCLGKGGQPKTSHCDTRKGELRVRNSPELPMNILPTISAHIKTISYSSSGLLRSSNDLYNGELNNILNLNATHLKQLRRGKWVRIFAASKSSTKEINNLKMKRLLEKELAKTSDGKYQKAFPGMCEYMLKHFC